MTWKIQTIEDGPRRLVLREDNGVVELVSGRVVLLSSAALETERAFGKLVGRVASKGGAAGLQVLVGGLGFGATVRGVLDIAGPRGRVVVAEKIAAVASLVRGPLAHLAQHPLSDPRVNLVVDDVAAIVARANPAEFDAILLDVDNGPHWASFRENARLYTPAGLAAAATALSPGGLLAVWSGYAADAFSVALRSAGLAPSIVPLEEHGRVRARAYIGIRTPPRI